MDRGAWRATVCGVTKSWTRLSTRTSPQSTIDWTNVLSQSPFLSQDSKDTDQETLVRIQETVS